MAGDVWTWTSLCADTKLICNWMVGERDPTGLGLSSSICAAASPTAFSSLGHRAYVEAVEMAFDDIDYAMLVKIYGAAPDGEHRYSPPEVISCATRIRTVDPDPAHISTSFVERSNLSMRMHMRRFTRLTNAHSKKLNNHRHAISPYFTFYNWTRIHKTLRTTPAMAAGLTDRVWTMEEIIALMDEAAPKPGRPKTYKKRAA